MIDFEVPTRGDVSEKNQVIFDDLKNTIGMVPNLYATMAYSDTALANYLQFQNGKTSFSTKEKEVINLVVSQINGCHYCQSAHTFLAKLNGLDEKQTHQIRLGFSNWDNKIDALVKLAKAVTESKGTSIEEELEDFYDAGYTKANLIDLILLIADKIVMNYLHNITKVPIDFPIATELEIETH